ncbi:MAG: cobalamin biosynthesis protein [Nitrososphaeraceae archaeon]|jgi:cobalt-precorrin 5A hydrolase|nr:cobalamin biosynthesis protein [Nitrososphaeraceae archaeon]MDW0155911.1 cobalamin biosynthesis protein [Nitrososphaeraceae archaeon]
MSSKVAIVCITKNGINISKRIKEKIPSASIYAQSKHKDSSDGIIWFEKNTKIMIEEIFKEYESIICIFSLGAVIRLISNLLKDKKTDPAVIVIDDKANFVISTLSGHLGGANSLTKSIADILNSTPVITTAADVNETIAVDLLGSEFKWRIENFENVTKISAFMVNEEKIGVYQDTGETKWWNKELPKNVSIVKDIDELRSDDFKAGLIISDKIITDPLLVNKSVIYRPKSLVVGLGFHWDTTQKEIEDGILKVLKENGLSFHSIRNLSTINRGKSPASLGSFSDKHGIPLEFYDKEKLDKIMVPNPSDVVKKYEGTSSVSEASSILSSGGELIVTKQKFPPNLTVAVSRINSSKVDI